MIASYEANELLTGASYADVQGTASLQNVAEEKYIALYWQGVESWTEWRRTGYPALQPVADANPSVSEALRYYYNGDEESLNSDNYETAVSTQGPDALTTPVWWMP